MVTPVEARRDLSDLFLHVLNDFVRVFAGAHDDDATNGFAPVYVERTSAEVAADLHRGDISQVYGRAATLGEDGLVEVGNGVDEAEAADDELHAVFLDDLAADVEVALTDGVHDLLQGDARGAHFRGGNFDLILPHEPANARHLSDAGNGVELVAHEPILQRAKLAEVVATALGQLGVDIEIVLIEPNRGRWRRDQVSGRRRRAGHRRGS